MGKTKREEKAQVIVAGATPPSSCRVGKSMGMHRVVAVVCVVYPSGHGGYAIFPCDSRVAALHAHPASALLAQPVRSALARLRVVVEPQGLVAPRTAIRASRTTLQ